MEDFSISGRISRTSSATIHNRRYHVLSPHIYADMQDSRSSFLRFLGRDGINFSSHLEVLKYTCISISLFCIPAPLL